LVSPAHGGNACPVTSRKQSCNTQPCPVPIDCQVSAWSAWSACSKPCGGGEQTQTRTVMKAAAHGGIACPATSQTQPCNQQSCPVDCQVSAWSGWSACSKPCGGGEQTQTRTVVRAAAHGGKACPATLQQQWCNKHSCPAPVDCQLSEPHWSACSKPCGGGQKTLTRTVTRAAAHGGKPCSDPAYEVNNGAFVKHYECNMQLCPAPTWADLVVGLVGLLGCISLVVGLVGLIHLYWK
jgi:hypothetical protein